MRNNLLPIFIFKRLKRRDVHCCPHRPNVHTSGCNSKLYQGAGNDGDIQTVMEMKRQFMKIRGVKPGYNAVKDDRSYLLEYLPKSQKELPPRSVKDSFRRAIIPLSNPELQEKYVTVTGNVRFGRLMEDLDMFSDWVAMNYVKNPKQPKNAITSYIMVTLMVDHITFTEHIPHPDLDIRIAGHVSGVGKTTIETTVWLEQDQQGATKLITKAVFLMAARNATLSGGAIVNPLVPQDQEEKLIVAEGEARKRERAAPDKGSFPSRMPDAEEQRIIHQLFLDSMDTTLSRRVLPPGAVWMSETTRNNNIFSYVEDRNFHNTVFGGFLMRHALEMAWFTAYFHGNTLPTLRTISNIHFRHAVPLGALISFHGQVVYTEGNLMEIFVHGDVHNPYETQTVTSIVFYFTYESPEPIKGVKPNTYYEAMMYIDGRRHFLEVMNRNGKMG